jgi:dTDP-L-rhamnose 4-epimerase
VEGRYRGNDGAAHDEVWRSTAELDRAEWDPRMGGTPLVPVPTPEEKAPVLSSVYALSKYDQERMCLLVGNAYHIPTVALRLFNVYGPRQALSNPYTGALATFASRLLNDRRPIVYEDGGQRRDFVNVLDVARAFRLALESGAGAGRVLNVGSGRSHSIREVAERMAHALGCPHLTPQLTGQYRVGDIRHCFADTRKAEAVLGLAARVHLDEGLAALVPWLRGQKPIDRVDDARRELVERGLAV